MLWDNGGLKQIRDDMSSSDFPRVGVDGINPDFSLLARSMHCHAEEPTSITDFQRVIQSALTTDRPTVITVCENSKWLL